MKEPAPDLLEEIRKIPLEEGENKTGIPGVSVWRFTTGKIQMPQTDHPYLYLVQDCEIPEYVVSLFEKMIG